MLYRNSEKVPTGEKAICNHLALHRRPASGALPHLKGDATDPLRKTLIEIKETDKDYITVSSAVLDKIKREANSHYLRPQYIARVQNELWIFQMVPPVKREYVLVECINKRSKRLSRWFLSGVRDVGHGVQIQWVSSSWFGIPVVWRPLCFSDYIQEEDECGHDSGCILPVL